MPIKYLLLLLLPFQFLHAQTMQEGEKLLNTTIKIESKQLLQKGGKTYALSSSGSGFFFEFNINEKVKIPVIVTNKHVVKNSTTGTLYFKKMNPAGLPIYGSIEKITLPNFSLRWIYHPDTSIDLAILPLFPILNNYSAQTGQKLFYLPISENILPTEKDLAELNSIEDVFMIGYPYGLRDTINDLPIVRKGITATPVKLDYNKKKEFLIDMPVYFGSSGSPIFIYNQGGWFANTGMVMSNTARIFLLGINYATYTRNFEGKISPIISQIQNDSLKSSTVLPLYNIGIILKSELLLDFKPLLQKLL